MVKNSNQDQIDKYTKSAFILNQELQILLSTYFNMSVVNASKMRHGSIDSPEMELDAPLYDRSDIKQCLNKILDHYDKIALLTVSGAR